MGESAGAGRLNRVLVDVEGDVVALPWDSRDQLLQELRRRDDGEDVIRAFEAVGASRPVELDVYSQVVAVETIRAMRTEASSRTG
jgi:hypothetical protein